MHPMLKPKKYDGKKKKIDADTKAVRENITGKHVNTTSLIRSSPNAPGLCLLVQPSVVASLLCFQRIVLQQ